ncbi:AAA family ATPase [Leptospira sp. GIMC2001]|uniref:AAA family ATPase n=1 Tax=Leptospira sp. GIMC2001 TaxID=1513297 RepID=UPI00234943DF|nr:ATP-binding protein [Leptospira sp. GIMC2001]WCL47862.1 ATP-binding protein [Leptospira sp. GIMC2001]
MPVEPKEIDFLTCKETLIREFSNHPLVSGKTIPFPEVILERNETKVKFRIQNIDKEKILDSLQILKNHIENIRIHTIDSRYFCFQALNENLFDTKNLTDNLKIRFSIGKIEMEIEATKRGNYKENEILAILDLFKFFNQDLTKKQINPNEVLRSLGIEVFDPKEAKIKGKEINFDHIFGYEEIKREILETVIMPLQNPSAFAEVSKLTRKFPTSNRPRAILFEGEPGVGKTTLSKAISCQCGIPMIYVPIESIMSKYFGESAQNLALIFDAAQLFPQSLVFLDEIDSLAGRREDGMFEATRTMLSVLLRKLDGFEGRPGSVTIGATNRKQDLDSALLSRFDKSIYVPLPNASERSAILEGFAMHLSEPIRRKISEKLDGLSGRKLKDYCDYVERKWATILIEKKLPPSAPDPEMYWQIANEFNPMN